MVVPADLNEEEPVARDEQRLLDLRVRRQVVKRVSGESPKKRTSKSGSSQAAARTKRLSGDSPEPPRSLLGKQEETLLLAEPLQAAAYAQVSSRLPNSILHAE